MDFLIISVKCNNCKKKHMNTVRGSLSDWKIAIFYGEYTEKEKIRLLTTKDRISSSILSSVFQESYYMWQHLVANYIFFSFVITPCFISTFATMIKLWTRQISTSWFSFMETAPEAPKPYLTCRGNKLVSTSLLRRILEDLHTHLCSTPAHRY